MKAGLCQHRLEWESLEAGCGIGSRCNHPSLCDTGQGGNGGTERANARGDGWVKSWLKSQSWDSVQWRAAGAEGMITEVRMRQSPKPAPRSQMRPRTWGLKKSRGKSPKREPRDRLPVKAPQEFTYVLV